MPTRSLIALATELRQIAENHRSHAGARLGSVADELDGHAELLGGADLAYLPAVAVMAETDAPTLQADGCGPTEAHLPELTPTVRHLVDHGTDLLERQRRLNRLARVADDEAQAHRLEAAGCATQLADLRLVLDALGPEGEKGHVQLDQAGTR